MRAPNASSAIVTMPPFDVIGMMPATIGTLNPGQLAALAEVVKVAIVEEKLRADVIGAGVDLALEVVHLLQSIGRRRMTFGKAGNADAEAARDPAIFSRPRMNATRSQA